MSSKNYLFYLVLIFLAATSAQARDEGLFGTIGERIDGLGRNVANIFSPDDNNTAARSKYAQQKTDSSSTFARSNENTTPRAGSVYNSTTPSTSGSTESNTTPNNNASNTRQVQAYRSENRVSTPSNVGATPDTAGVNKYTPSQPTGIYASENLKSSSPYSSNSSVRRSGETLYTADRTASASGNVSTSGSVSNNALISAQAKDSAGRASAASEGGASNGSTVDPSSTEYGRPVGRPLHERLGQSRQSAFDKEKNAALTGKEIVSNAPSTSASENMTATPDNASNTTESAPATSNPTRSNIARTPIASPQAGTNSNVGATSTNNQRPTPAKRPSPTGSLASNATTTKIDTPASSGNAENAANNAPDCVRTLGNERDGVCSSLSGRRSRRAPHNRHSGLAAGSIGRESRHQSKQIQRPNERRNVSTQYGIFDSSGLCPLSRNLPPLRRPRQRPRRPIWIPHRFLGPRQPASQKMQPRSRRFPSSRKMRRTTAYW